MLSHDEVIIDYTQFIKSRGLLPLSIKAYRSDISLYLSFCAKLKLKWNLEGNIFKYLSYLSVHKVKPSTVQRKRAAIIELSMWYKNRYNEELFSKKKLKSPKLFEYLPNVYSNQEIKNLLDSFDTSYLWDMRDLTLILFLFGSGLRANELLHIKLKDISPKGDIPVIGKGNKKRLVILPSYVLEIFHEYKKLFSPYIEKHQVLFFNQKLEPLTYNGLYYIITTLYKKKPHLKVNSHLHPHGFRHSFATALLENGADIRYISELLGHASLNTTQKYTKVNQKTLLETMKRCHPHFNKP